MHTIHQARISTRSGRAARVLASLLVMGAFGVDLEAQETIGVPFVGKHHLSFYTTEVSRDGIGEDKAALYGGTYGRRFGDRAGNGEVSVSVRAGARAFEGTDDGIFDTGLTVAATRAVPHLGQLNVTGAVGAGLIAWGQSGTESTPDEAHLSVRVPVSGGISYDVRIGAATIAPFAAVVPTYSSERDYLDEDRVASDGGWRVGTSYGVTARFREAVFSLTDMHRERGMPHSNRVVFSAGMSW